MIQREIPDAELKEWAENQIKLINAATAAKDPLILADNDKGKLERIAEELKNWINLTPQTSQEDKAEIIKELFFSLRDWGIARYVGIDDYAVFDAYNKLKGRDISGSSLGRRFTSVIFTPFLIDYAREVIFPFEDKKYGPKINPIKK